MLYYFDITGRGGASIYGKEFDDEINDELKHTGMLISDMTCQNQRCH